VHFVGVIIVCKKLKSAVYLCHEIWKVGLLLSDRLLNVTTHVLYVCKYVSLVNFTSTVNFIAGGKIWKFNCLTYYCINHSYFSWFYPCLTFLSFDITCIMFLNSLCCYRESNNFLYLCRLLETGFYLCIIRRRFFLKESFSFWRVYFSVILRISVSIKSTDWTY
jgi:hypothetical protein